MPVILAHEIGNPIAATLLLAVVLIVFVGPPLIALAALNAARRANRTRTKKLIIIACALLAVGVCGAVWTSFPTGYGETRDFLSSGLFLLLFIIGVPLGISLLAWFLLGDREKKLRASSRRVNKPARILQSGPPRRSAAEKRS